MSNSISINPDEKNRLEVERDRLREKLAAIEADYRKGLAQDSEDRAIELENADVLEGIAKALANELAMVEEQLAELEAKSAE